MNEYLSLAVHRKARRMIKLKTSCYRIIPKNRLSRIMSSTSEYYKYWVRLKAIFMTLNCPTTNSSNKPLLPFSSQPELSAKIPAKI